MCAMEVNMTYEPFSKEPEYLDANKNFIQGLPLTDTRRILDLASGTGVMTDFLLERCPDLQQVVGVDLSRESLVIALEHFKKKRLIPPDKDKDLQIHLLQGTADIIPLADQSVEAVIMGNSIHMLPDENALLAEINRVMQPNGLFAFYSSFYAGTMPPGTEKVHHEWVKQAAMYLSKKSKELKAQGKPGIKRKRGTAKKAFSKPWPSISDWQKMLVKNGFTVKHVNEREVMMDQRCFETIGAYAGLASVLFSGYPVHYASEALQETAGLALEIVEMPLVPRLWLEVYAVKNE